CTRGATSGTRAACRRSTAAAACCRPTRSAGIRRALRRSASRTWWATSGSGPTSSSTNTPAPRSCAAAATTGRRLRTGTSPRPTAWTSTESTCWWPRARTARARWASAAWWTRSRPVAERTGCAQALARPGQVRLDGLLGEALEANRRGRLSTFITGPDSPAIAIFDPAHREHNEEGDWYGEHAGKWLAAAAKAAARSDDADLRGRVLAVADHLLQVQAADGYLGTYAPARRFMVPQPPRPESWNGEPALRTWDIWTHAYLLLGLMEVHRCFGQIRHLDGARRIADLCWRVFCEQGLDITSVGNHDGISATVLPDPAARLHLMTGEPRYLELAERILEQANAQPRLALLDRALAGADPSEIATGKAYQLC